MIELTALRRYLPAMGQPHAAYTDFQALLETSDRLREQAEVFELDLRYSLSANIESNIGDAASVLMHALCEHSAALRRIALHAVINDAESFDELMAELRSRKTALIRNRYGLGELNDPPAKP